ncbi:MAG: hypothetical protein STHCBS139747_006703 [Sporothrix thermara]
MSGYFGALPPELLQDILDRLNYREKIPLMRCSKTLLNYVEPQVFASKAVRDLAMHWAISSDCMSLVRRLVNKFDCSPSFYGGTVTDLIDSQKGGLFEHTKTQLCRYPQSTLLAVLKRAPHAKAALSTFLDLGATLDVHECPRSKRDLFESGKDLGHEEVISVLKKQKRTLFRRIVSMPTDTDELVEDKIAFIRFFYEHGYRTCPEIAGST